MKTLYISDLDGTLLRTNQKTSDFTNKIINELVEEGLLFSYATARSYNTSHKVTEGMTADFPLIVYNGVFVRDNASGEMLLKNFFDEEIKEVVLELIEHDLSPIVYAYVDGVERFTFNIDGVNDIDMFEIADEAYAVENAVDELKEIATGVIACNDEDGVAKWLYERIKGESIK